jgi:hypothetical protein
MTKFIGVLLGAVGVLLIVIVILIVRGGESPPEFDRVEIKATEGTQVFVKLPEGVEQYLDNVPADNVPVTVDVPISATVILRYNSQEKVYPNGTWQGGISYHFTAAVSINAVPWAKVLLGKCGGIFPSIEAVTPRRSPTLWGTEFLSLFHRAPPI